MSSAFSATPDSVRSSPTVATLTAGRLDSVSAWRRAGALHGAAGPREPAACATVRSPETASVAVARTSAAARAAATSSGDRPANVAVQCGRVARVLDEREALPGAGAQIVAPARERLCRAGRDARLDAGDRERGPVRRRRRAVHLDRVHGRLHRGLDGDRLRRRGVGEARARDLHRVARGGCRASRPSSTRRRRR